MERTCCSLVCSKSGTVSRPPPHAAQKMSGEEWPWASVQTVESFRLRKRSQSVQKVLEERYLRHDVSCGSPLCGSCAGGPALCPLGRQGEAAHYLVVGADALAAYHELLELREVTDFILLASGVKQVRETDVFGCRRGLCWPS